ncbi:MAG: DUF4934 domain-containing protein [Tannerella sp.]|nr:DUF4934 domain-containing protein [Tannerella sp.]
MALVCVFSCRERESGGAAADLKKIDVEQALQNVTRLKVSDFGKTVRYIPLETADSGLVGGNPVVKVLKRYIVIEYGTQHCLLFDREDGRFIAEIGHRGQDPEAFTSNFSRTDGREEFLYFERRPNRLVKYDMKGHFRGRTEFAPSAGLASSCLITDSEIIGYFDAVSSPPGRQWMLGLFDREGNLKDTVPPLSRAEIPAAPDEIAGIAVQRNGVYSLYGQWARAGAIIIDYKNDRKRIIAPNAVRMWKGSGDVIRFKEDFTDTLYTVSGSRLVPSIAFHTGRYRWPAAEKTDKRHNSERIFIADVSENDSLVFFQCIRGLYTDSPVLYNGLYDRKTGETRLGRHSDGIEDDITRFMPFIPSGMSTSGEFVSLVEAADITAWLEQHPEAPANAQLSFLKELDAEANPVVILVK